MSTIVQRQPADKPGDEIVSSVLTTIDARRERGTYQINEEMDDRVIYDGTVVGLDYYQPGEMVTVDNKGTPKNGLVTKCSGHITIGDKVDIRTQVTVETIK